MKNRPMTRAESWQMFLFLMLPIILGFFPLVLYPPTEDLLSSSLCENGIYAMSIGASDQGWATQLFARNRVLHLQDHQWQWAVGVAPGLGNVYMVNDHEGWGTPFGSGLYHFDGHHWARETDPLTQELIGNVAIDANGDGWIIGKQVLRVQQRHFSLFPDPPKIYAVAPRSDGEAWAVGDGIYHFLHDQWTKVADSVAPLGSVVLFPAPFSS